MPPTRAPLSRDRVLTGAVELADRVGIEGVTIRRLADELDVKPMTIYHHVANKEAIVDGMVDRVFAEIDLPPTDVSWREAMAVRCRSARAVLARHWWAAPLMESRTSPGSATLTHHDAVLGCFRTAGFSVALTAHAYAVLDSYVYGFALQEAGLPATGGEELTDLAEAITADMPDGTYPHLREMTERHFAVDGYDFGDEFDFGLTLLLHGLEAAARAERV